MTKRILTQYRIINNIPMQHALGFLLLFQISGDSANAVPHYHKLCTRLTHIWGNRRGQPNRSAMEGPRPGGSALLITDSPVPGKYDFLVRVKSLRTFFGTK